MKKTISIGMTKKEFKDKLALIEENYIRGRDELLRAYAISSNAYEVGDIIEDHYHIIKIKRMSVSRTISGFGTMLYYGDELRKDLLPKKHQINKTMCQDNVKRKLN